MYDRIFVPLDGFPLAEQVLPYVTRIAAGMGIPIHLAQVVPPYPRPWLTRPTAFTKARYPQGPATKPWTTYKQRQANISGVEVTCDAHEGDKSPESLVAMSNHGRSGITRLLMGSVTDKVLHHIKNPMLIFREHRDGDPDTKLETIIVLLDGSPLTESVLPLVTALAKALDLKVTLVRAASEAENSSPPLASIRSTAPPGFNSITLKLCPKRRGARRQSTLRNRKFATETGDRLNRPQDSARFGRQRHCRFDIGYAGQRGSDDHPWPLWTGPVDAGKRDRPGCAPLG